ncbi:Ribulose-phosphate 3-epimerase [hydrothermal vent metagenome]|uniref:ribulose-phosphate 3-epimerase n=1 Tax=hydrothermal vent metagenome TaxID=652676 RepID=A0A3B1DSC4_9ZZZZ
MNINKMLVAPSVLSANFGKLDDDIISICDGGCDMIHIDVMDGHFVPNMTIGPVVVSSISKITTKPLDIHLMVEDNNFFIDLFSHLKPKYISFHIESEKHPHRIIQKLKALNIKPAIVLNPHSTPASIEYLLKDVDMVLLMSVNPGFGGQVFIDSVIKKAKELKKLIDKYNSNCLIEVDGGVNNMNVVKLKDAGVDIVVSGSYIYNSTDIKKSIQSLKV